MIARPVNYEQTDSRWKSTMYSNHNDRSQTIGTSGCGPTCAAMVAATLKGSSHTPPTACQYALKHGYRSYNDGTTWAFFVNYLGSLGIKSHQTSSTSEAVKALEQGKMVITCAAKGIWTSSGHFILAYGMLNGKVQINDPNSVATYRELADLSTYKAQTIAYWIVDEDWRNDKLEVKKLNIKDMDSGKMVEVEAVFQDGTNYIKLRDLEKLAPVVIDYDSLSKTPTVKQNKKVQ